MTTMSCSPAYARYWESWLMLRVFISPSIWVHVRMQASVSRSHTAASPSWPPDARYLPKCAVPSFELSWSSFSNRPYLNIRSTKRKASMGSGVLLLQHNSGCIGT